MDTVGQSDMFYQGKLLLATPGMKDFRFEKAVILVCSHNSEGAMGIIVNKLTKDLNFNDMGDCERLLDVFSHNIETKKMIYKMNDAENKASMTLAIIKSILNKI